MAQQRLPIVNSDDGQWGDILRQYLAKEHYNDDTDNAANGGHQNITIRAGVAGAGGAPLKFTSGTLLTTPEVGAVEFAGDNLYVTQTSGTTRKKVALYDDSSGATGDLYYRASSGYFTPLGIGASSQVLTVAGGIPTWQTPVGSIGGNTGGTDNAILRADGTGGATTQGSVVTIADTTGDMAGVGTINALTLPASNFVGVTDSQTITSKRISPRVVTVTQSATPSIPTDTGDVFIIAGLAQNITGVTVTGTPVNSQRMRISITGTAARTIAWGSSFEASTKPLPTTTVSTNRLDTDFIWNATTSKWRVADEIPANVLTSSAAVTVAQGGTGRTTSTTAYGIIAAGTTATGAHQTISPGSSGQFLKSAGTTALASFASITAADITGTTAQFNTALTDNDFATLAGTEMLTNKTLTTPKIGTALLDTNGNQMLGFVPTSSAVNYIATANNVAGSGPVLTAFGSDTNIDLNLSSKGTGVVKVNGNAVAIDSAVVKLSGDQTIAGNKTFSNPINMSSNRLTSVADPTSAQDAATKNYVDTKVTRITKSGSNSTGSTVYIRLATLPVDDNGNYATLTVNGRMGGWVGVQNVATWNITLSNRSSSLSGTQITAAVYGQGKTISAVTFTDLVVYTQSDKSAIVYFAIPNNQYYTFDIHVDVFQATIDYTGTTVTPTGSVNWRLSQDLQAGNQNGQLYIANNDSTVGGDTGFTAISTANNSGVRFGSSFDGSANPYAYINLTDGSGVTSQQLMALSSSVFDMKTHRLANLVNPTNAQDAATKNYVDTNTVTATGTAILTNKTINASNNTLSNITDTNISASAAIALSKLATGYVSANVNGAATTTTIWRGTQAQYNAISTPDSNTLYFISG